MTKHKSYKLKKGPKIFLIMLVCLAIIVPFIYKKVQEYLYKQTNEYALLQLGYKEDDVKNILDKLSDEEEDNLLTYDYNEFIPMFIQAKYFMYKNLDGYLDQVITQEEDFFKYHGTDGYDYDEIVAIVNTHADRNFYTDTYKTDFSKGYGILCNKFYELGSDYEPDDLVDISIKYYYGGPKKIRSEVYEAFKNMWSAAYDEGIYLIIDSAYRDYDSQVRVYKEKEDYRGISYADGIAARPGFSEHQTGLSLDIYSKDNTVSESFKNSKAYSWLTENAHKYGFILRYPDGKKKITGFNYESWHYRYLGVDLATKVYNEGITFDEYYAFYLDN
ncbi:MAG: M15 family metallopeptidase [Erysipelotrichales bacterium]|nr:M15 family metallopeptidase [Erysipelotrichales bacterium]